MNGFFVGDIISSDFIHRNESFNQKDKHIKFFSEKSNFSTNLILNFSTMSWLIKDKLSEEEMLKITKRIYLKACEFNFELLDYNFVDLIQSDKVIEPSTCGLELAKVPAIGWYGNSIKEIKTLVSKSIFLNNEERISKICEVYAVSIFMFRNNIAKKPFIKYLKDNYEYDLKVSLDEMKNETNCEKGIKNLIIFSLICVLQSNDFEEAMKNVLSLNKQKNFRLLCSITASLAEAYFQEIPSTIIKETKNKLPKYFKNILCEFKKSIKEKRK